MRRNQNSTAVIFLTILISLVLSDSRLFAYIADCKPVCEQTKPNGSGVLFPGGCDKLTFGGCDGSSMETGSGLIYTFNDYLPCFGTCAYTRLGEDCGGYIAKLFQNGLTYRHKLVLRGDVDRFPVMSFTEEKEYDISYLTGISISSSRRLIEEGNVGFTYTVTTKEWKCNSECSCSFDTQEISWNAVNCSCSWEEIPLFTVDGSFTIKENKRTDFDPFSLIFSPTSILNGGSYFTPNNYNVSDEPFTRTYNEGEWNSETCSCDDKDKTVNWGINEDEVVYRVKFPGWENDVRVLSGDSTFLGELLPSYIGKEGWVCDVVDKRLSLDMGIFGILWFHHETSSTDSISPNQFLASSIEHCLPGESVGQGTILWRFDYEDDALGKRHLSYIYNGTDPNLPEQSPKYYKLTWDTDYDSVQQEYYNTTIDENAPLRIWQASFDSQGRAVEYSSGGCSSGCGGSTFGYEKLEYYDQYEGYDDLIKRKYNSNGDIVLENEYQVFQYGDNWPEYSINFSNSSFELPDPNDGMSITGIPPLWSATDDDPNLVSVFDPNDSQFDARYDTGEVIPDGDQILTLMGGSLKQVLKSPGIVNKTTYFLEVDTGAFTDSNTSEVKITLLAYDPHDPNGRTEELIVIDVDESSAPDGFGEQLDEGKWVTQSAFWDSSNNPEYWGWCFQILIEGNYVDVDHLTVSGLTFMGGETEPLLISQIANPNSPSEPNVLFVEWDYNASSHTAVEKKWVDSNNARVTKYTYSNESFNRVTAKTEYGLLGDDPDNPSGDTHTTYYTVSDANGMDCTIYPSGKRMDVEELDGGRVIKSYSTDIDTGGKVNIQEYTYLRSNVRTHTDSRGGVTEYEYNTDDLLTTLEEPESNGQQQITSYTYDDARRISSESRKDTDGSWVYTSYDYTSGLLDKVIVDPNDDYTQYVGLNETTEYKYNDFNQVIREKGPDGTVRGKTYGLGGELSSEFVLNDPSDIDESWPDVVSQTLYSYDSDGHIEYIKKVKDTDAFTLCDPNNIPGGTELVTTKYEYDFLGRRTAVIEDLDGQALETTYEYNNQGEIVKTTLPNGKWTETTRDGRGLVKMQIVGHDNINSDDWLVTLFYYDANGNLIERVAPDGVSTKYEYDNLDRLVKVNRGIRD